MHYRLVVEKKSLAVSMLVGRKVIKDVKEWKPGRRKVMEEETPYEGEGVEKERDTGRERKGG